jgi:hypothetical protein
MRGKLTAGGAAELASSGCIAARASVSSDSSVGAEEDEEDDEDAAAGELRCKLSNCLRARLNSLRTSSWSEMSSDGVDAGNTLDSCLCCEQNASSSRSCCSWADISGSWAFNRLEVGSRALQQLVKKRKAANCQLEFAART